MLALALGLAALAAAPNAQAQKHYAPGITDTEIKIGQTEPLSGPASAYSQFGRAEQAFIRMINDQGGVNGRKLKLIQEDDGYQPPKTLEQTRKLVESDGVAVIFGSIGTPTNMAIRAYLNEKKVPQIFIGSGSSKFDDPKHFPWTLAFLPSYLAEGRIYARWLLATKPDAKVSVLYQNDDYGKDLLQGFQEGFGADAGKRIIATASYETSDPTVEQQVLTLRGSGANVFFLIATPKFAAQSIRSVYDSGWKPLFIDNFVGSAVAAVLKPAGLDKSVGLISAGYEIDPTDPQWESNAHYKEWRAWMAKYMPDGDVKDQFNVTGYDFAAALVHALQACGDDLTRDNIMAQATHMDFAGPMFLPGIKLQTTPADYVGVKQMVLQRFNGTIWVPFGEAIDGRLSLK
jgi:ABC-type branched-subunit amino acid transport system substrate-binding protein